MYQSVRLSIVIIGTQSADPEAIHLEILCQIVQFINVGLVYFLASLTSFKQFLINQKGKIGFHTTNAGLKHQVFV